MKLFFKVINNIPKINEVYVTHQACSLSLKKGIDGKDWNDIFLEGILIDFVN